MPIDMALEEGGTVFNLLKERIPGLTWEFKVDAVGNSYFTPTERRDIQVWRTPSHDVWNVLWRDGKGGRCMAVASRLADALQRALDRGLLGVTDPDWGLEF